MTETQKRIKAYQSQLPGLKERVAAVALLLVMSMAMMTSATFAWLTISRNPELAGANTTIAANGNLEIALATGNGEDEPGESKVGDSSAAEGQSVVDANITWGNLINLSDPSYGLDNLVLRPAQLNNSSLLENPLFGATYTVEGRIEKMNSNFSYTQWVPPQGMVEGYFGLSTGMGVRAISSTKVEAVGVWAQINELKEKAENANQQAINDYIELTKEDDYMESLAYIMGVFMTDRLNVGQGDDTLTNPTIQKDHLGNLIKMYEAFGKVFDKEADALAKMLNLQLFLIHGGNHSAYTDYSVETLMDPTVTAKTLEQQGLKISNFETFKKDYNLIKSDYTVLQEINASGEVMWQGKQNLAQNRSMKDVIGALVNLNTCTLDGTPISSIGASNAIGYLNKSCNAVITNGVLYNFEHRTGAHMDVGKQYNSGKGLKLEATVKRDIIGKRGGTIYALITTSAPKQSLFAADLAESLNMSGAEFEGTITAEDTYGMAIDFWVRSNATDSYLVLEGNVLTKTEDIPIMGLDESGNQVELYTLTREVEVPTGETDPETGEDTGKTETMTQIYDVYKIVSGSGTEQTTTWHRADNHAALTEQDLEGAEIIGRVEQKTTVLGYEGVNRAWSDDAMISADATTQGSGSCYVYYADTPEDQAKSLKLLEAFNVSFVDSKGNLLATAVMDTQMHYAENGRVIVPLKLLETESVNLGADASGVFHYAITALEKNTPKLITAIVYLDGTKLTNDEVMAATDIQGRLNIQFGSNQSLEPIGNEELANKILQISASVEGTSFDFDTHQGDMVSKVTLNVSGSKPSTVTAFFTRSINETQGSREKEMEFKEVAEGVWEATYTFTAPGNYILRSVELDGIPYDLPADNIPQVNIKGFAISSINIADADPSNHIEILSASSSYPLSVNLKFATNDPNKMPKSVQGRFLQEDGTTVNITFKYNPTTQWWTGTGTFLLSGEYTMRYVILDGKYVELAPPQYDEEGNRLSNGQWYTADVTLGMRVAVYTDSPESFVYIPAQLTENQSNLKMKVKILDNTGNEMYDMTNVKLRYTMRGSDRKMDTDLRWDGSFYSGTLSTIGAGTWKFEVVYVGSDELTTATTSPTFTIIPPDPPAYYKFTSQPYQYVPNGGAKLNAELSNASTATVDALIRNKTTGAQYIVTGEVPATGGIYELDDGTEITKFYFTLPKGTVMGKSDVQDGNWEMLELYVRGYFDSNGNYVEDTKDENGQYVVTNPMTIDMRDKGNVTKAVQTTNIVFPTSKVGDTVVTQSKNFGKNGDTIEGTFMQEHEVTGLSVEIKDFEGMPLVGIHDVKLQFKYKNGSDTNGGYIIPGEKGENTLSSNTPGATVTVTLTAAEGSPLYQQKVAATEAEKVKIFFAGNYTTSFSYKDGNGAVYTFTGTEDSASNNTKKLPENAPVFTVWSKAPSVTIVSVTPGGKYSIDTASEIKDKVTTTSRTETGTDNCGNATSTTYYTHTWNTNAAHKAAYLDNGQTTTSWISADKLTATVYFRCVHADDATYSGGADTTSSSASDERLHYYYSDSVKGVPTVTLRLSGISGFTSATLNVSNTTHIYTGVTYSTSGLYGTWQSSGGGSTYSWTSEGDVTRTIGYVWGQKGRITDSISVTGKKTPAGTITADTLTVVYNGQTYIFDISDVTIKNPY